MAKGNKENIKEEKADYKVKFKSTYCGKLGLYNAGEIYTISNDAYKILKNEVVEIEE